VPPPPPPQKKVSVYWLDGHSSIFRGLNVQNPDYACVTAIIKTILFGQRFKQHINAKEGHKVSRFCMLELYMYPAQFQELISGKKIKEQVFFHIS